LSSGEFYKKEVSDDVEILIQDPNAIVYKNSPRKIFASLFASTPEYLAFLLRILLTTTLIIFVSRLILNFSPKNES